jgi:putative ABC transport system substrate-binding protein
VARAQQTTLPVIGLLGFATPDGAAMNLLAVLRGLSETGYVEGRIIAFESRWAEGFG